MEQAVQVLWKRYAANTTILIIFDIHDLLIGITTQSEKFPIRFIIDLLNKQQRIVLTGESVMSAAVIYVSSSYNGRCTVRAFPGKRCFSDRSQKDGSVPCLRSQFHSTITRLVKRHFVESVRGTAHAARRGLTELS